MSGSHWNDGLMLLVLETSMKATTAGQVHLEVDDSRLRLCAQKGTLAEALLPTRRSATAKGSCSLWHFRSMAERSSAAATPRTLRSATAGGP